MQFSLFKWYNIFNIVDNIYLYILHDIWNMYQWYFMKFYQSHHHEYSLFWYAMFKNIALFLMCNFHCSNDHDMFDIVDNAYLYIQYDISNVY